MSDHDNDSVAAVRAPRSEVPLRAGPITATFDGGALRWLRWGEIELVQGVYVAVRDDRWRTIHGDLEDVKIVGGVSSFEVTFGARHVESGIDFRWLGRIVGDDRGFIQLTMDGVAESTFERNRIGFCVLHPMDQAGTPVTVITPHGTIQGSFPEHISPNSPFTDITALRFPVSSTTETSIKFDGDLFEMEDHRNWSDASFKTFCTPLRNPIPVTVREGTRIHQSVTIEVIGAPRPARVAAPRRRATRLDEDVIDVLDDDIGSVPSIGTTLAPGRESLDPAAMAALRTLKPAAMRAVIVLDDPGWEAALAAAGGVARGIGARLEIEAVAGDDGQGLYELVRALANERQGSPDVYVYPTTGHATTALLAERLREIAVRFDVPLRVGGGSRANFAELNRAELPIHLLDVVGFAINPQVHAFDDASLLETIAAQAVMVRDARRLVGSCELVVGPITLLPRFNPYTGSRPSFGPDTEFERRDARQDTWFAAAWTLASLASMAGAGTTAVSYHEVVGPAGLIGGPGHERAPAGQIASVGPKPVYAVMGDVLAFGPARVFRSTGPADIAVLALGRDGDPRRRILVANLRDRSRTVGLRLSALQRTPIGWCAAGGTGLTPFGIDSDLAALGAYEVIRFDVGSV